MDTSDGGRCGTIWPASVVTKLGPNPLPRAPPGPAPALTFPQGPGGAPQGPAPGGGKKNPSLTHMHLGHRMGLRGQERGFSQGCLRLGFGENYEGKAFSTGRVAKWMCRKGALLLLVPAAPSRAHQKTSWGEGEGLKVILNTLNVGNLALLMPLQISSLHCPLSPLKSGN